MFFRQKAQFAGFALKDGLAVEVRATPSIFEARGEFQLNVETVRLAGIGALYEKFERLKARLAAAGWFAAERKRQLPPFPRRIGIVTSPRAAALSDILTTLRRRWSSVSVILYPAMVQGEGAAADIARAIATASARGEVDVLIVARGGGSIEDLWAFNEEVVARAIVESAFRSCPVWATRPISRSAISPRMRARPPRPARRRSSCPTAARCARTSQESHGAGAARARTRCKRGSSASTASRVAWSIRRRISRGSAGRRGARRRGSIAPIEASSRQRRARCASVARRLAWLLRKPLPQGARLALLHDAMRRAAAAGSSAAAHEPRTRAQPRPPQPAARCWSAATRSSPMPTAHCPRRRDARYRRRGRARASRAASAGAEDHSGAVDCCARTPAHRQASAGSGSSTARAMSPRRAARAPRAQRSSASASPRRRSARGGAARGPSARAPASLRRSASRECRRTGRAGRACPRSTGCPALSIERRSRRIVEVGFTAIVTTMSWPVEMPPRMPPALFDRNPCGVISSRVLAASLRDAREARADLHALDGIDAHHRLREIGVEPAVDGLAPADRHAARDRR